jgi:hypothetical protein
VTDGLKRCLRNFGNLLGSALISFVFCISAVLITWLADCLYDKHYIQEVSKMKAPKVEVAALETCAGQAQSTIYSRSSILTRSIAAGPWLDRLRLLLFPLSPALPPLQPSQVRLGPPILNRAQCPHPRQRTVPRQRRCPRPPCPRPRQKSSRDPTSSPKASLCPDLSRTWTVVRRRSTNNWLRTPRKMGLKGGPSQRLHKFPLNTDLCPMSPPVRRQPPIHRIRTRHKGGLNEGHSQRFLKLHRTNTSRVGHRPSRPFARRQCDPSRVRRTMMGPTMLFSPASNWMHSAPTTAASGWT